MNVWFVTGTDTDAGKTLVTSGLLYAAKHQQLSTLGLKPIASGSQATPNGLRNSDALALQAQSVPPIDYATVNPIAFAPAIAPHLAALEAGQPLNASTIIHLLRETLSQTPRDFTLIEGAGGWRVPLNEQEDFADLAIALELPVILVVGLKLGCLNHARLTAEAIFPTLLPQMPPRHTATYHWSRYDHAGLASLCPLKNSDARTQGGWR